MHSSKIQTFLHQIARSTDLPSILQLSTNHLNLLNISQPLYMRTTDSKTLHLAKDILKDNPFLQRNILGIPPTTHGLQSQTIHISLLKNHPKEQKLYNDWVSTNKPRLVSIGGPSASDQCLLSTLIPSISHSHSIHFYLRNYIQSNSNHSAKQLLARHAPAIYSDPNFTGHRLLPLVVKRLLRRTTVEEVMRPGFTKIDVKLNSLKTIWLYFQSQVNWFRQMRREKRGVRSQHDFNRLEGRINREILRILQKQSGVQLTTRRNKHMTIHLAMDRHTEEEIILENKLLKDTGLGGEKVDLSDIFPEIYSAWGYPDEGSVKYDIYNLEKQKVQSLGGVWKENKTLTKVLVSPNEKGGMKTCGVLFEDGEFVPADKVHLSLGYRAKYLYQNSQSSPLTSYNTTSTGVSTSLLLKTTPTLSKLLHQNQQSFQLMGFGGHWTHIAHNQDYILVRATAGGNTGAEGYMPSYFLNLLINSRRIFGQAMIGVVSAYACSRAVNFKNSTQFCQVAEGLIVSYGKGGTGHIKRGVEAAMVLGWLGLEREVKGYFDGVQEEGEKGGLVSQALEEIWRGCEDTGMYYKAKNNSKLLD